MKPSSRMYHTEKLNYYKAMHIIQSDPKSHCLQTYPLDPLAPNANLKSDKSLVTSLTSSLTTLNYKQIYLHPSAVSTSYLPSTTKWTFSKMP